MVKTREVPSPERASTNIKYAVLILSDFPIQLLCSRDPAPLEGCTRGQSKKGGFMH